VDDFVDIVSKNGCLLLNVGPQADGRIPQKAQEMLLGMGGWLKVNGEAIYGTRPWVVFGEGPTHMGGGGFSEAKDQPYTAEDIRFTTKGEILYAIALAWPDNGTLTIKSLPKPKHPLAGKVSSVRLLGYSGKLDWSQTASGLVVKLPSQKPCDYAFTLKISGKSLGSAPPGQARKAAVSGR
jgi:alpha-L-fucosidase